jgi:hypothetical protein
VEGFSTPRSNKRTAGLPNPCPIGLQSRCSILSGSPPVGLHQSTAPHQTHTRWDTRPSAAPASSSQTHTTPEYLPLGWATRSTTTGIPATRPQWIPAWSRPHSSPGYPPLPNPPPFRPRCAPAMHGMTGPPTPRTPPAHQALSGSSSLWKDWSPAPLEQAPVWCETAASTSLPGALPLRRSQPQLYSLPR